MSRPYLNINSASYNGTTDVVTLDVTALRLRGQSSFSIDGFSSSVVVNLVDGYVNNPSLTFSAVLDTSTSSTSTTTLYSPADTSLLFDGTASATTNVNFTIASTKILGASGYTFSGTFSLSDALDLLVATMSFTSTAAGFTAEVNDSRNRIVFTAPANTGIYYNDLSILPSNPTGLALFTFSNGASFSGGVTQFQMGLSSTSFGSLDSSFPLTIE